MDMCEKWIEIKLENGLFMTLRIRDIDFINPLVLYKKLCVGDDNPQYTFAEGEYERLSALLQGLSVDAPTDPGTDETTKGPYMWVINKYGGRHFPWKTIENPHGNDLAIWQTKEECTVFFKSNDEGKPVFEKNSGVKVPSGTAVYCYRKVLSGLECDGGRYVCTLDPVFGAIPRAKLALVGVISPSGFLI